MMEQARANGDRLSAMTRERTPFSTSPNWGITRLTTTDADREVRDWFVQACKARGCAVTIDDMDNLFARWQVSFPASSASPSTCAITTRQTFTR